MCDTRRLFSAWAELKEYRLKHSKGATANKEPSNLEIRICSLDIRSVGHSVPVLRFLNTLSLKVGDCNTVLGNVASHSLETEIKWDLPFFLPLSGIY